MKKCQGIHGCGENKPLSDFRINLKRGTHYTTCIPCENEYKKKTRQINRKKSASEKLAYLTTQSERYINNEGLAPGGLYKRCGHCQIIKLSAWFNTCNSTPDGLQNQCTLCDKLAYQKRKDVSLVKVAVEKKCTTCQTVKSADAFAINPLSVDGYKNKCLTCERGKIAKPHSHSFLVRRTMRLCDEYNIPFTEGLLLKKCPDCALPTPIEKFGVSAVTGDRLNNRCTLHNVYHDNGTFHGFKMKANQLLLNEIKNGRIIRPTHCEFCGKTGDIEAHHADYSKALDVNWLCVSCHHDWHRNNEFVMHFFQGDVPKDVVDATMKKYFRHFHIETTKTLSTYIGILAK